MTSEINETKETEMDEPEICEKFRKIYDDNLRVPIVRKRVSFADNTTITSYSISETSEIPFLRFEGEHIVVDPRIIEWRDYIYISSSRSFWIRSQPFSAKLKVVSTVRSREVEFYGSIQICLSPTYPDTIESVCLYSDDFSWDLAKKWLPIRDGEVYVNGALTKAASNR